MSILHEWETNEVSVVWVLDEQGLVTKVTDTKVGYWADRKVTFQVLGTVEDFLLSLGTGTEEQSS